LGKILFATQSVFSYFIYNSLNKDLRKAMKEGIHPAYKKAVVTCVCGNVFETRSTVGNLHIEICASCHPFYTGKQKLLDSAGRIEKFKKKYAVKKEEPAAATAGV
jgi:large subunit ribosomal protein L31